MPSLLANLVTHPHFSVDVYVRDDYSHYIQISELPNERVLQTLPFDPTDRSIPSAISPATLKALGEQDALSLMAALAKVLPTQMGAKEFFLIPSEQKLDGYSQPEEEKGGFGRMRHCPVASLVERTQKLLASSEYKGFAQELDQEYEFLLNEADLVKGKGPLQRYAEIAGILDKARFTKDKQDEYKLEDLQGKMSRFKSEFIRPVVMVNKKTGQIRGLVRALLMGSDCVYLSDEVMDQELFDFKRFPGETDKEKSENREMFLLAYLMNKACTLSLSGQRHLFIVAADDEKEKEVVIRRREFNYDRAGFEKFPMVMEGWRFVLKRCPPPVGPVMQKAQDRIKSLPLAGVKPAEKQKAASAPATSQAWKYWAMGFAALAVTGLAMFLSSRGPKGSQPVVKPDFARPMAPTSR